MVCRPWSYGHGFFISQVSFRKVGGILLLDSRLHVHHQMGICFNGSFKPGSIHLAGSIHELLVGNDKPGHGGRPGHA